VNSGSIPGYVAWLAWLLAALAGRNWAKFVQTRLDLDNQALKHRTEEALKHRAGQDPGTT
jgi:hypothetical protein